MMRVLALLFSNRIGGCEIYRVTMPFHYMQEQFPVIATWVAKDVLADPRSYESLSFYDYDGFLFPRAAFNLDDDAIVAFLDALKRDGKKVIIEYDDDLTLRKLLSEDECENEERVGMLKETLMRWADAVFVSTTFLAQRVREWADVPVYELPNCVDIDAWGRYVGERNDPALTIGLTGSITHYHDWEVVAEPLYQIKEKFPYVRVLVAGYVPDYLEGLGAEKINAFVPYQQYIRLIREVDIVICPIVPGDLFNKSKSAIKAIEGMASVRDVGGYDGGAAVVATDSVPYRRVVNGKNGILVPHTSADWYSALEMVVSDGALRARLQREGHKWVKKNRDIRRNAYRWYRAFREVLGD